MTDEQIDTMIECGLTLVVGCLVGMLIVMVAMTLIGVW